MIFPKNWLLFFIIFKVLLPSIATAEENTDSTDIIKEDQDVQLVKPDKIDSSTIPDDIVPNLWAIKFALSTGLIGGNTEQVDFTSKIETKRRTASSEWVINYIGNFSKTNSVSGKFEETINNHRLSTKLDIFVNEHFSYNPVFAEFFTDAFQNIKTRIALGAGLTYPVINTEKTEWGLSVGPAYVTTSYTSVLPGEKAEVDSASLAMGTKLETKISTAYKFSYKYNLLFSKTEAGGYTHHMIAIIENKLIHSLNLELSLVWDRINSPTVDSDGNMPKPDDYRLMFGINYTY
ncbi:MAG: DUF481 domain-containing protein [Thiohalomonadales bacterium]